jgi:hypothetical protein
MNPVEAYQKQLKGEVATVEKEIEARKQQVDLLNRRLEALKRALELFESDQSAITELLRTADPQLDGLMEKVPVASSATARPRQQSGSAAARNQPARSARLAGKRLPARRNVATGKAGRNGGLKRIDMIAAVLQRQPGSSVRELMAGLARQFNWKPAESGVTNLLYTNPGRFAHTKADRTANRPVAWSLNK